MDDPAVKAIVDVLFDAGTFTLRGEPEYALAREALAAVDATYRANVTVLSADERSALDQRFEEWWLNAGSRVTPESPRKGLAYVAFCAGTRNVAFSNPEGSEQPTAATNQSISTGENDHG